MCVHAYQLDEMTATKEERLMDKEAVREHHRQLAINAAYSYAGRSAFDAHLELHKQAAKRIRAARVERVK